jgi:hypothetical protein
MKSLNRPENHFVSLPLDHPSHFFLEKSIQSLYYDPNILHDPLVHTTKHFLSIEQSLVILHHT